MASAAAGIAPLQISKVCVFSYEVELAAPIVSSFGARHQRGALLISVENVCGAVGWGEVWCGMPSSGALHRAHLLREFVAPVLAGMVVQDIGLCVQQLRRLLMPVERLAGEPGPVSQVLAGIDCALWDLAAKVAELPLYRLLGGHHRAAMPFYASGIAPDASAAYLDALRDDGFAAFKFKAGYDDARTLPMLRAQYRRLHSGERMMIDANCGWELEAALAAADFLADVDLEWIEEPLAPDSPTADWQRLSQQARQPLAAGENLFALPRLVEAFDWLGVVQPDVAKWGGVTGVFELGQRALQAGLRFCPHSFGTRVAAATTAHVLAAVGGDGYLELDVNPNPLRTLVADMDWDLHAGRLQLTDEPGNGLQMRTDRLAPYLTSSYVATCKDGQRLGSMA
jgi:L-alanine-DL-glutamate epimerase-like enolase superfamily enzyme